mgnify:FL=1
MKKRLGILGGTFDPIHIGHLEIAKSIYEQLHLEKIIFIPAYIAPHKVGQDFAPAMDRYIMTKLAIEPYPYFTVSDMELKRSGVSYTYDTLVELHKIYPEHEFFFIIGADSVTGLHTWHRYQEMFELTTFVGAERPGYDNSAIVQAVKNLGKRAEEKIMLLDTPENSISSTSIREKIRKGESLNGLVPRAVEAYILEHKLYLEGK